MKIDPNNFNLTPKVIEELERNYDTRIVFEDYFIDFTVFDGPITKHFFKVFLHRLKESVGRDEIWKKSYLGTNVDGWEHLSQKLYRGANPPEYAEPHQLHWKIDIYFRPRRKTFSQRAAVVVKPLGIVSKVLAGLVAVCALDAIFPAKEGESTMGRNAIGAFAFMEYLNAKHENDQLRQSQE